MAELTELDTKVAEILGLAQAAQTATKKVVGLVEDDSIKQVLQQMHDEAAQTEQRLDALSDSEAFEGKKTAVHDKARETKQEAEEMMKTYLGDDADGLDGLEFLWMSEAGELGHVEIAKVMSEQTGNTEVGQAIEEVLPIQERHMRFVRESSLELAKQEA